MNKKLAIGKPRYTFSENISEILKSNPMPYEVFEKIVCKYELNIKNEKSFAHFPKISPENIDNEIIYLHGIGFFIEELYIKEDNLIIKGFSTGAKGHIVDYLNQFGMIRFKPVMEEYVNGCNNKIIKFLIME